MTKPISHTIHPTRIKPNRTIRRPIQRSRIKLSNTTRIRHIVKITNLSRIVTHTNRRRQRRTSIHPTIIRRRRRPPPNQEQTTQVTYNEQSETVQQARTRPLTKSNGPTIGPQTNLHWPSIGPILLRQNEPNTKPTVVS